MKTRASYKTKGSASKRTINAKKRGDLAVAPESGGERGIRTSEAKHKVCKQAGRGGKARTESEPKTKPAKKKVEKISAEALFELKRSRNAAIEECERLRERVAELEGKQAPGTNVGRIPAISAMTMSEILIALNASQGRLPILIGDVLFLRGEYTAAVLKKPRKWARVSPAAILKLGVGRADDCRLELDRLGQLIGEIRTRFEQAHRAAVAAKPEAAAERGLAGPESIPAPRTPAGNGKQTKKAKGRAR